MTEKKCACGAPLRSDNRSGACRRVECRREYKRAQKNYGSAALYVEREPRPCRECRQLTRSVTGWCQRQSACREKYRQAWGAAR